MHLLYAHKARAQTWRMRLGAVSLLLLLLDI